MADAKLGYRIWTIAIFLLTTSLKGVSSMKLHRHLGISRKSPGILSTPHPRAPGAGRRPVPGPGGRDLDEIYVGGSKRNRHESRRAHAGRTGPRHE